MSQHDGKIQAVPTKEDLLEGQSNAQSFRLIQETMQQQERMQSQAQATPQTKDK